MNDPESLAVTLRVGACLAVIAAVMYLISSRRERGGFRLAPSNRLEWAHYGFRSLILAVLASMALYQSGGPDSPLYLSAFVLLIASFAFEKSDSGFSATGLVLSCVAFLLPLLFPTIR
jgi:hypothetical protein